MEYSGCLGSFSTNRLREGRERKGGEVEREREREREREMMMMMKSKKHTLYTQTHESLH